MLARILRQNVVSPTTARPFVMGRAMFGTARDVSDADNSDKTFAHPAMTQDDPNHEMRGEKGVHKPPVFVRQKTGYHRSDGSTTVFRDSFPSIAIFFTLLLGIPIGVGFTTNPGATWNGWYQQNQVLRRQTDVKKEFGKGGGGWGTGPAGMGYDQRKAEAGVIDKGRKRDLLEGMPSKYKAVNEHDIPDNLNKKE